MKRRLRINYDEGINGNYMGEALRVAESLERNGHRDVTVNDLGNGAEVEYTEEEADMKIVNCTPHAVTIVDAEGKVLRAIESNGKPIRLKSETVRDGEVDGIPLSRTVFGEPENLPEPEKGTFYIVSQIVKNACPERKDLVVPAEVLRDEKGIILGCQSLGI